MVAMNNVEDGTSQSNISKIKIFHTIKKDLSVIGIIERRPMNANILLSSLMLASAIAIELIYIFKEAETFFQYTQSIYMCSAFILAFSSLMIMVLHLNELFKIINDFECVANTSKQ